MGQIQSQTSVTEAQGWRSQKSTPAAESCSLNSSLKSKDIQDH